jgi:predicted ATP-dependent endonuclease of OLD family
LLGEVIYIPAIKELKDELKTTNQSTTIMKLLKKIVHPKLKDHSALNSINSGLSELNKTNVFEELNSGLSEMMKGYGCDIKIEIDPIKTEEVLSSASLKIIEENLDKMPPENKGTGLQRALLVNLIKFWAATDKKYKKLTQNEPPTILLFEEPEVFQHPQKQSMLFGELKQISTSNTPVFVTTHSTHFVSEEDKDLTFITRTHREKNFTQFKQITQETIDKAEKSGRFKFWKYLDSEKNKLFFADKVILCEGNTEKLISNYIIRNKIYKDDYINQSKFTVIDCVGKFNLPHFIRICNDLSISYMLFYDLDTDKQNFNSKHEPVNKEIEQEKSILCNITLTSSNDIESRLFKEKINNADKNLIIEKILNNEHIQHEFNLIQRSFESFLKISKK